MVLMIRALSIALVLGSLTACGPTAAPCDASRCPSGCCAPDGSCQGGTTTQACGAAGAVCQQCGATETCSLGACVPAAACVPLTCEAGQCGSAPDGCGGVLECPACMGGQTCGAGGVNRCGSGTCTPTTCAALGKTCGVVSDGCDGVLRCGSCAAPDTCGGGGVANVCGQGCTPTNCAKAGKNCGIISDGCGGTVSCGTCATGACSAMNVCIAGCTPTTCAAQNAACGTIPNGCGGTLECGGCAPGLTCGGAGMANTCGATCAVSCPAGYACNSLGVCTGGSATALIFNVRTVAVSGRLALNGATPTAIGTYCAGSPNSDKAEVTFTEKSKGYLIRAYVRCDSTTFEFSTALFPGTYEVRVSGRNGASTLPAFGFVARDTLDVSADVTNLILDVRTVAVSGRLALNGATPTAIGTYCAGSPNSDKAEVTFTDSSKGYLVRAYVRCDSTTFEFSTALYPGTYEVRVSGRNGASTLPAFGFVARDALQVAADVTNLILDVRTVAAAGRLALNGATPTAIGTYCAGSPNSDKAEVSFTDSSKGYLVRAYVRCDSTTFEFSTALYPGTYEVRVSGRNGASTLPAFGFVARDALQVSADVTNLILDVRTVAVSGRLALNGATPTAIGTYCSGSPNSDKAEVSFTDSSKGYLIRAYVRCDSTTFEFSTALYPGTYEVRVAGRNGASTLPAFGFVARDALQFSADVTNLILDVRTVAVSGRLALNGATPTAIGTYCAGSPNSDKAEVTFTDSSKGYLVRTYVRCDSATFEFSTALYPGTYEVRVSGRNGASTLPAFGFVARDALQVAADVTNLILDVRTVAAAGRLALNGATPTAIGTYCAGSPNSDKAEVSFTEKSKGYLVRAYVRCDSATYEFSTALYPGTYEVRVSGRNGASTLPSAASLVAERLAVP